MFLLPSFIITSTLVASAAPTSDTPPTPEQVRQAVDRSLPFLEKSANEWWYGNTQVGVKDGHPALVKGTQKNCASCHHLPMTVWCLTEAKQRGFAVEEKSLDQLRDWTFSKYVKDPDFKPEVQDKFGGGAVSLNTIYLSIAAASAPSPDEQAMEAMKKFAGHLIAKQEADGSWKAGRTGYEPPIGDITEALTMQALLVVATARDKGLVEEAGFAPCRDRALEWLLKNKLTDRNQSLLLHIQVTQRFGKPEEVQPLVKQLLEKQNTDGGWSQTPELFSDALATGQTLYVLALAGVEMPPGAIGRAQAFLTRSQLPDGSWWVTSREKGRKGLAISHYGSGWATLGLLRTSPGPARSGQPGRKTEQAEKQP